MQAERSFYLPLWQKRSQEVFQGENLILLMSALVVLKLALEEEHKYIDMSMFKANPRRGRMAYMICQGSR